MNSLNRIIWQNIVSDDTIFIEAPILAVSITEDRAEIRRFGEIEWQSGKQSVFVPGITVYAHDASLRVSFDSNNGPAIGNARILRTYTGTADNGTEEERLLLKLDSLATAFYAMVDEQNRRTNMDTVIQGALKETRESILREVIHQSASPSSYTERLDFLFTEFEGNLQKGNKWKEQFSDLLEEIQIIIREADEDMTVIGKGAGVLISFDAEAAGRGGIGLTYEVPCVQWRPLHEAELTDSGQSESVRITTYGALWQRTGEDWNDVLVTLSTARPSLGLDMPVPDEDFLEIRNKTAEEKKKISVSFRDQRITDTGVEPGESSPGVPDDGGETQQFQTDYRVTIPSNGQVHIFPLKSVTESCQSEKIAVPEISERVFLRSKVTLSHDTLLAGPVELSRNAHYIGRGFLDFAGPGQPFHLYWGSEDYIHIMRTVEKTEEEAGLISKARHTYMVRLNFRNLQSFADSFTVQERLPVSELEQVEVKVIDLPESASLDDDGFIWITVTVPAMGEQEIEFSYQLILDKNVEL